MKTTVSIFWFRRDLRLYDNHGLYEALKQDKAVLPIFIFDSSIFNLYLKMMQELSLFMNS